MTYEPDRSNCMISLVIMPHFDRSLFFINFYQHIYSKLTDIAVQKSIVTMEGRES